MCNRYEAPPRSAIELEWAARQVVEQDWDKVLFPRGRGTFIRRAPNDPGYSRELVVGQWGLIPWFAKEVKLPYQTNNARSEELAAKASYKQPWARGQRCIIPAESFDEPYWGPYDAQFKKCEWWRFRRADGRPWGLAGLWNTWTDKATGEVHESYTMLTINADGHPLMGRMHKNELDPKTKAPLPLEDQDKRSVIPIELADVDAWLAGTQQEAEALLRVPAVELFSAGPA
ncbi:MAG: SOS response-associated peptidase family protein [Acidovorax sp.]|uniref:SOS response-associated peptidase n=1 Tax=Acidovorax sp. TaxID=1872122 RepID=UPI00261B919D|nr:SOS response-associated peptidase family protein [Acidovorax sp.]MDH4417691.1 SOS response-associated peptidase family protein [Acidovorax sp.]